jgi:hypothetical protein
MSGVNETNVMEQLMHLKAMTVRTGGIHEAQKLQLISWPRLSKQIARVVAKVDPENKAVTLECESPKYKETKFEKELFKNILVWVRTILWDETRVVVKVNKKRVFDSATH